MHPSCLPNPLVCIDATPAGVVQLPSAMYYLSGFCPHIFFKHPEEAIKWQVLYFLKNEATGSVLSHANVLLAPCSSFGLLI